MPVTTPKKLTYSILLPDIYPITKEKLEELQKINPDLELSLEKENILNVTESSFLFEDYGYFGVKLPGLNYKIFCELYSLNDGTNFEFGNKEEVFIKMGVFRFIGKFTLKIISSFENWVNSKNCGEVYPDPTEYELDNPQNSGKKEIRIPDVSYISYQTAPIELQNSWLERIPIPPNMAMEIVSAKYGLKGDLKKMKEFWMPAGVDVGIVVCPFSEKIYIFEKKDNGTISGPSKQSIYDDFSHPLLPGYQCNYGQYIKKYLIN